ncbi:MAG: hypothetical protein K0U93_22855 [Gammaproteobacteria bacterium]|nr:hypothetical protein [Gammaproteobacteria bacterium]
MDESSTTVKERITRIHIARHFLDGADAGWVQRRFHITLPETQAAWSYIVAMLEQALGTPASTVRFFELPDALSSQTEACLRLLLDWHDELRQAQLINDAAEQRRLDEGNDVETDEGSAESGSPC